jgi:hypothetical protein
MQNVINEIPNNIIQIFLSVIDNVKNKARVFIPTKHHHPCPIFVCKSRNMQKNTDITAEHNEYKT